MQSEISTTKYLVVGRHNVEFPEDGNRYEVVASESVMFPQDVADCREVLMDLINKASSHDAAVLLQAMPAQVARAIVDLRDIYCEPQNPSDNIGIDALISLPQPREAGIEIVFDPQSVVSHELTPGDRQALAELFQQQVTRVNRNIKTRLDEGVTRITVDPTPKFKPSQIIHF